MSSPLSSSQFFHGTARPFRAGDAVLPAGRARAKVNYAGESDPKYSYATTDPSTAWSYAEKAWNAADVPSGPPRVYRVSPMGAYEKDPEVDERGHRRGNFSSDRRSKHGWRVEEEIPMPSNMGDPEEWR